MGIKFLCPNGHKMNVKAFLAGKRGKCPKCGASVRIPLEAPASDSGEDLLEAGPLSTAAPQLATSQAARPVISAPAAYAATSVRPVALPAGAPALPVGAAAIPVVPIGSPGYLPAAPAVTHAPTAVPTPPAADPIAQAPAAAWYVRPPSGGQYGPARGDIMRKWVAEGRVSGDSLVWREGFAEWQAAGQLFPTLAAAGASAPPPPPAESAEVPKVSRAARKLSTYEARKNQGNGVAIAILVLLGIICVALVIGLAVVLSRGNNDSTKEAPNKTAAVLRH